MIWWLALPTLASALQVINRTGDLYIANRRISPDGWERDYVLAGKSLETVDFPGPLIKATRGDHLKINLINDLVDPSMVRATSIHWHGIFQKGTNFMDGVASVTQCPIIPGNSFLYDFKVPNPGTYWYHSHLSVQYCDGLRGPLVVYNPEDPYKDSYDVDDESTVISVADWYHPTARTLLLTFLPVVQNATLINGKGRYPENPSAPLAIINVVRGKRYRFRLISMSCDPSHTFSIDGHNLTIIEVDGQYTQKHTVDQITMHAGQRYSVILNANQPVNNYWIRASPDTGPVGYKDGINSAVLRYTGAPEVEPTTIPNIPPRRPLREWDLHPLHSPHAPTAPDDEIHRIDISLGFEFPAFFYMNGVQWKAPSVPVLLQILSGERDAKSLLPDGLVYTIPRGKEGKKKVVEVNLWGGNAPSSPHPFHLHGHAFSVVKHPEVEEANYKNPVRRDVTYVSAGNLTTIRFVADNAGPWMLHCHKDFHLEDGLAVVLAEDVGDIARVKTPEEWDRLCPEYEEFNRMYPKDIP